MKTEELLPALAIVAFIVMLAIERIWPARKFPAVPHWHWICIGLFIYAAAMNAALPMLAPEDWLRGHRLFNLSSTGLLPSVVIGYLIITFATFAWHRASHEFTPLWRGFHQLYHSPRHLNIYAANCIHAADQTVYVIFPTLIALFVLGVDPLAATILGNLGAFNALFQHWNVHTPQWIGYLFQRPESHCFHHQRDLHRYNYSDFPPWDILFGTFRNPRTWAGETGFDEPADRRYGAMLAFVDVNAPMIGANSFGQVPERPQ